MSLPLLPSCSSPRRLLRTRQQNPSPAPPSPDSEGQGLPTCPFSSEQVWPGGPRLRGGAPGADTGSGPPGRGGGSADQGQAVTPTGVHTHRVHSLTGSHQALPADSQEVRRLRAGGRFHFQGRYSFREHGEALVTPSGEGAAARYTPGRHGTGGPALDRRQAPGLRLPRAASTAGGNGRMIDNFRG